MSDVDTFDDHFTPKNDVPRFSSDIGQALIQGKQTLLRDESNAWYQACLPKLAAIAAQLRREAEQRADNGRPCLELALHFDELAMQPPPEEMKCDDDEGPY